MRELNCNYCPDCPDPITHIDEKGFIYCGRHGFIRQQSKRCRKLRPHELNRLKSGKTIKKY